MLISYTQFPDGQPHLKIECLSDRLIWPIRNSTELLQLLQISNALDGIRQSKPNLIIPYLMGARSDRHMEPGDSFDLQVIANMINYCKFPQVSIYDVHSEVALALIDRSINIPNTKLLATYHLKNSVLICPDAGAAKKHYPQFTDIVYCTKQRDLTTGKLKLKVHEPEHCTGRYCVVIDDLCDGGATFIAIAEQIKPLFLTLIVSHGIFSKGFDKLFKYYNQIITSDSYQTFPLIRGLTQIKLKF
ncbi:MAG: hypothetical protein NUV80_01580 [Candidatus Berkelbacteria bacterium]|nr:hypothetical protein [Candidatus Berkelbacteria bacterium]